MQQHSSVTVAPSQVHLGQQPSAAVFGSDLIVDILRALGVPYAALNPGASFRGLHDSLVNFPSGGSPQVILCCHEEIAVAVAHGYAKATGRPMAAALHNIVGLQHAAMAIFNAWCDRAPVLVLGGTGPMDTGRRRPWIDWVHTALVQGNQVRDYVKWDDQPATVGAIPDSLIKAYRIAMTPPQGPVYVCFDVELQEERLASPLMLPDVARYAPPRPPAPDPQALEQAAALLSDAQWPVIVAEGAGRDPNGVASLQALAELLAAPVLDSGGRVSIPNGHPMDLTLAADQVLREADAVLALDISDLQIALGAVLGRSRDVQVAVKPETPIIHITLHDFLQRSWVSDTGKLTPVDVPIAADVASALPWLVRLCRTKLEADGGSKRRVEQRRARVQQLRAQALQRSQEWVQQNWGERPISSARLYGELWEQVKGQPYSLVSSSLAPAWRRTFEVKEPTNVLGSSRGGGVGYGPGGSIGAALAFKGQRLCIGVLGDGELLYTTSALWTAAHHQVPLLMVIFNNRSYYQDEGHQHIMAVTRDRPLGNVGIGIHLREPDVDFTSVAKGLGVEAFGPVTEPERLGPTLKQALRIVQAEGRPVLVDVVTQPR